MHNMTLRPLFDRVLIRPLDPETATKSGIHIPEGVKPDSRIRRGKVLAVGSGDRMKDGKRSVMFCRPGDDVLYTSNPNNDWEMDAEDGKKAMCSVINEEQFLLAILN